jgi:branched-chain amino acid transport system substrate-binding protein
MILQRATFGGNVMRKARTRAFSVVVMLVLVAAACGDDGSGSSGSGGGDGDSYRVSVLASRTGDFAIVGEGCVAGFEAYVHGLNERGGIEGRTIEYDIIDTDDPTGATAGMQQAIAENPVAIVQCAASELYVPIANLIEETDIPVLSLGVPQEELSPEPPANAYMTSSTPAQNGEAAVLHAKDLMGGSLEGVRVVNVGSISPFVDGFLEAVDAALEEEGAELVDTYRTEIPITSFSSQAAEIAAADPDIVFLGTIVTDTTTISEALDVAGLDPEAKLIAFTGSGATETLQGAESDRLTVFREAVLAEPGTEHYDIAEAAGVADSIGSTFAITGWLSGAVLEAGLQECLDECGDGGLNEALEGLGEFEPPGPEVAFGPFILNPDRHNFLTSFQFYGWDPETQTGVPVGAPVTLE